MNNNLSECFTVALVQCNSTDSIEANIAMITPMLDEAVAKKASLICLPENAFAMRQEGTYGYEVFTMQAHPGVQFCCQYAAQHKVHIVIGSIRAAAAGSDKTFNRQVWISSDGNILAHYDKIHLFDVTLPNGKSFKESKQFLAGESLQKIDVAGLGKFGLGICYDLRFPNFYRELALQGAEILLAPSAFTRETGKAHWEILLRARAIENAAFMLAPAQCGEHPGGRTTYGHSMVVDPWGNILAQASEAPEVLIAEIDLDQVKKMRAQLPVLQHHQAF